MTDTEVRFNRGNEDQAEAIIHMMRDAFSDEFISMTIMGCHGVAEFYRRKLATRWVAPDSLIAVAQNGDDVVGWVELRIMPDTLFLNYIVVSSEYRSQGVAGRLLQFAIDSARTTHHKWLRLDVLDDNVVARRWYEGMGFKTESISSWYEVPIATSADQFTGYIAGIQQSEVLQTIFGFSQVEIVTATKTYRVGILGDSWLRVYDPEMLTDPDAIGVIHANFRDRRGLVILADGDVAETINRNVRCRAQTHRMAMPLAEYDERVQQRAARYRETR